MGYALLNVHSSIIDWCAEFKRGRANTNDVERSGHSKSAVDPEKVTEVHKRVLGDRKLKLREIDLTPHQKQQRVEDSERLFES